MLVTPFKKNQELFRQCVQVKLRDKRQLKGKQQQMLSISMSRFPVE
jgi:small nuclear ribonucleoprotein (snRNP)-like protein